MRERNNKIGDPRVFVNDAVAVGKFFVGDLQETSPQALAEISSWKNVIEFLEGVDLEQETAT
jgi:hypothetical protein